jgi:hypothetical protein
MKRIKQQAKKVLPHKRYSLIVLRITVRNLLRVVGVSGIARTPLTIHFGQEAFPPRNFPASFRINNWIAACHE